MSEKFILEDLLNALIELEETGNKLYTELSERVENTKVSDLFSLLARQELKHKENLSRVQTLFDSKRAS